MHGAGIVSVILIILNVALSYKGFKDAAFLKKYDFQVSKVFVNKEYYRIFSSGFLHGDWMHLIFNMYSLYAFSSSLEFSVGELKFLLIYFGSMLGGKLLLLYVHRNHYDYSSLGASGAVTGVIFSCIALFPGLHMGFFLLPVSIPAWLYCILYIAYTIFGIKSNNGNTAHASHLGGGVTGMLLIILLEPYLLRENYIPVLLITIPSLAFIALIIARPEFLLVDNYFFAKKQKYYTKDHLYNEKKINQQKELDRLLDKISEKGMESLSKKEQELLEELSR